MEPAEDLFEGPATALPVPVPRRVAVYVPEEEIPAPVRHVRGYAPFLTFCAAHGTSAAELAADPVRLIAFVRICAPQIVADDALRDAAAVFIGNVIAGLRPDAFWQAYEDVLPTVGTREQGFTPGILPGRLPELDDGMVQDFLTLLLDWAQAEEEEDLPQPQPVPSPRGLSRYSRPQLPAAECRDADGKLIPYGSRWGADGPPEETYSVDSHPERFAGLHTVAQALINYLTQTYDAAAQDVTVDAASRLHGRVAVLRAVRLVPRSTTGAPLTFIFTAYPGVIVAAGLLHEFRFPACGCDACDESAGTEAGRLEQLALAVAAGGYAERYPVGRRRWAEYALTAVDSSGSEGGRGDPAPDIGPDRLQEAERRLQELDGAWWPWPLRAGRIT